MTKGTVSVRMVWPFMRTTPDFARQLEVLSDAGIDPCLLADPDARIPRQLLGEMISLAVETTRDVALGLHAAEHCESADFGMMDHAARACPDLRRALACMARYTHLQDDVLDVVLVEEGDRVAIELRNAIPTLLPATNDFQAAAILFFVSSRLGRQEPPLEVHLRHEVPTDAAEYARLLRAPVRYGRPHNAVVIRRSLLDLPVATANPHVFSVFDLRSDQLLRQLDRADTVEAKVRRLLEARIGREDIGIEETAAELHMSTATLRRRLGEENATFRAIVDELRRGLALGYVANPRVAIGEIAFLLGFSTQSAFGTAFRRWTGSSPLEHRMKLRATAAG